MTSFEIKQDFPFATPGTGNRRHYVSLAIDLSGLPCLVVGGGRIGTRKAMTLLRGGAAVTILAPEISPELHEIVSKNLIRWRPEPYAPHHLAGFTLAVAATPDPGLNEQIGREAQEKRILFAAASPRHCSQVIFPATWTDGEIAIAVHSHGRDCVKSKKARDRIAVMFRQDKTIQSREKGASIHVAR